MAKSMEEMRRAQRAEGPATVLAIGTATPKNVVYQEDYADYYFRITNSEHMTDLKSKFKRMCDKSMIRKRYMHLDEDILKQNPNICAYMAPSLDARQDIVVVEVPKLGKAAASAAIKEWGRPKSAITHLIFCTTSGVDMPGADYQLTKLLGLRPSVNRLMMYQQGCFAGGTVLRLAKDLAENNRGARVLVVCSEITAVTFRGPSESHLDSMVGQALFGDGAAALIVGSDPDLSVERPIFQMVSASQTILPDSEGAIDGHLREVGLTFHLLKDVPGLISKNIEKSLVEAFAPLGIDDWNSIFWVAHPGGPAILDQVEQKVGLKEERMRATREVLREYGNMSSACVLFIMDEMRRSSAEAGHSTTGEGLEWGVLFGFGPGLSVETVVLKSVPIMRLSDESTAEALAVKRLLGYRLPSDANQAKSEWYTIVEGEHTLWNGVSRPYGETIRAYLVYFQNQILRRSDASFCFSNGSIGNFFFAGARIFFQSLDAAIFLFSRVSEIPRESLVLPVISTNDRLTLGCELWDGTIIRGQNEISHPTAGCFEVINKDYFSVKCLPSRIKRVFYMSSEGCNLLHEVFPTVNPTVLEQLNKVDCIVYAMGSLFTSICPSLVLIGIGEVIASRLVPKVLLLNGSHDRETASLSASDFVTAITDALNQTHGDARKCLNNPPSAYVNALLIPKDGQIPVNAEHLSSQGIFRVVTVDSIHDPKVGVIFEPRSLISALTNLILEFRGSCLMD